MSAFHFAVAAAVVTGLILVAVAVVAFLGVIAQAILPPEDGGGIEALADATREQLPREWTAADWAELKQELSQ